MRTEVHLKFEGLDPSLPDDGLDGFRRFVDRSLPTDWAGADGSFLPAIFSEASSLVPAPDEGPDASHRRVGDKSRSLYIHHEDDSLEGPRLRAYEKWAQSVYQSLLKRKERLGRVVVTVEVVTLVGYSLDEPSY